MKKILIVDDSDTIRGQLKTILTDANYSVVEGYDGIDGLNKAKENTDVNLIISDVNMPEMDGLTMCSKIRENTTLKSIPIIMLTTETATDLKQKGKEAGVMGWIVKPFDPEKMKILVTKLLGT